MICWDDPLVYTGIYQYILILVYTKSIYLPPISHTKLQTISAFLVKFVKVSADAAVNAHKQ